MRKRFLNRIVEGFRSFKLIVVFCVIFPGSVNAECVILLHGLARTAGSMTKLESALDARGYRVANVDYPSREKTIEALAPLAVGTGLGMCGPESNDAVHFVTHSMGGILVRHYLKNNKLENLGHVVMIAPPNQGSEVVDNLAEVPGFALVNGPAGLQLGTGENSVPLQLGPVDYSVGIIAGTKTFNPMLSQFLPNPDDGKVSVERTKVEGMADFRAVNVSHPFIMKDDAVIEQVLNFIKTGEFSSHPP